MSQVRTNKATRLEGERERESVSKNVVYYVDNPLILDMDDMIGQIIAEHDHQLLERKTYSHQHGEEEMETHHAGNCPTQTGEEEGERERVERGRGRERGLRGGKGRGRGRGGSG